MTDKIFPLDFVLTFHIENKMLLQIDHNMEEQKETYCFVVDKMTLAEAALDYIDMVHYIQHDFQYR